MYAIQAALTGEKYQRGVRKLMPKWPVYLRRALENLATPAGVALGLPIPGPVSVLKGLLPRGSPQREGPKEEEIADLYPPRPRRRRAR